MCHSLVTSPPFQDHASFHLFFDTPNRSLFHAPDETCGSVMLLTYRLLLCLWSNFPIHVCNAIEFLFDQPWCLCDPPSLNVSLPHNRDSLSSSLPEPTKLINDVNLILCLPILHPTKLQPCIPITLLTSIGSPSSGFHPLTNNIFLGLCLAKVFLSLFFTPPVYFGHN